MSFSNPALTDHQIQYVRQLESDFRQAYDGLRRSGTLSASRTFQAYHRLIDSEAVVVQRAPDPFQPEGPIPALVVDEDEKILWTDAPATFDVGAERSHWRRYGDVFRANASIQVVAHVHTPYLGGWSGAHRPLPLRYAASQRLILARELPIYIDRRQPEAQFINHVLAKDTHIPAILEANGGSTFWGGSLLKVARLILLVEEGAQFQALAEQLGGSREFGAGVLEQQWRMTGLWEQGRALLEAAVA